MAVAPGPRRAPPRRSRCSPSRCSLATKRWHSSSGRRPEEERRRGCSATRRSLLPRRTPLPRRTGRPKIGLARAAGRRSPLFSASWATKRRSLSSPRPPVARCNASRPTGARKVLAATTIMARKYRRLTKQSLLRRNPDNPITAVPVGEAHRRSFALSPRASRRPGGSRTCRGSSSLGSELTTKNGGAEVLLQPGSVGRRTLSTTGLYSAGRRTEPVESAYETPRPKVVIDTRDGISARGTGPVFDGMQTDETLRVHGHWESSSELPTAGNVTVPGHRDAHGDFLGLGLAVQKASANGKTFTVDLVPDDVKAGGHPIHATGTLRVGHGPGDRRRCGRCSSRGDGQSF